ncbi:MAG: single-stranded DNA-binding protein [Deltaproteobacteria bacterium]|nr:single-stranded DNA-binding protein [Deltaproteobacteria bacterium]MBN2671724.1 single-stranded DNA-binding protein [Deltaproteobacteria bacterium]
MADGVNRVILVGNLGKDPEISYTQGGTARCRFPLATGETFNNKSGERQERTEWHNIVVWGKQGENVGKFLSKGRQVYIEGSLRTRSWDDEKSGQKKYMTEVNAQRVVFLGGKGDGPSQGSGGSGGGGGYGGGGENFGGGGFEGPPNFGDDDDIPF